MRTSSGWPGYYRMNVRFFVIAAALALLILLLLHVLKVCPLPADGVTDATAAIQRRLDALASTGGEVVLPPGQYLIKSNLKIPNGVALRGSWNAPHHGRAWEKGTTLLITAGAGNENGPAAIQLSSDSTLQGVTLLWPDQVTDNLQPYPWAIEGDGMHVTVENVTLVNAYQGIYIGAHDGSLHLIRNIFGCVLRRGIFIDCCTDIGRIENVHFNTHYWFGADYWSKKASPSADASVQTKHEHAKQDVVKFVADNLEAFIFGRSDWEYVVDTFAWDANSAYHFIKTARGACNGQFLGIGADYCKSCVQIDDIQGIGLQITNGEFTAFAGDPNSAIVTAPGAKGAAQFVNCNFWGIKNHSLWMQGDVTVTLADSHILESPASGSIMAEHGKLIVQGCTFDQAGPAVIIKPGVPTAVIMGNLQTGGLQVQNGIGPKAQIGLNETP